MIAIIPARSGSKNIPKKNIQLLNGHPLIAYSIIACKLSKNIDRIVVSTNDLETADIALKYGAEIPFMRPKEFATDLSRDVEFLKHFFENIPVEEAALIRPTSPLRNPGIIDLAIETWLKRRTEFTSMRTINELNKSPYKLFQVADECCSGFFEDFNGIKKYSNLPRQTFPKTYEANGYIDIVKKETVELGETFGDKILAHKVEKIIDIDSYFDLDMVQYQLNTKGWILSDSLKEREEYE